LAIIKSIKIDGKSLTEHIKVEVNRIDGGVIDRTVSEALRKVSDAMIGTGAGKPHSTVAGAIRDAMVDQMTKGLNEVETLLKAGISNVKGWPELSDDWVEQKVSGTEGLFWKNKGHLALGFDGFANPYGRALKGAKTVVKARARKNTFGKRSFSYELTLDIPGHREDFITKITRDSFASGTAYSGRGSSLQQGGKRAGAFAKIGLNEGEGPHSRPFIARLFAARGQIYLTQLQKIITKAAGQHGLLKA
jgi:hypothetical protein